MASSVAKLAKPVARLASPAAKFPSPVTGLARPVAKLTKSRRGLARRGPGLASFAAGLARPHQGSRVLRHPLRPAPPLAQVLFLEKPHPCPHDAGAAQISQQAATVLPIDDRQPA